MTNYYSHTSFIVPCTQEQAQLALRALSRINGELDEFAKAAIAKADNEELDAEEKIIRHSFFNHCETNGIDSVTELDWSFDSSLHEEGILIHHDESITSDEVIYFAQAVLIAFDLPDMAAIDVAHLCDKPRVNAFGGTAYAVTKDSIRSCMTSNFLFLENEAARNKERYYLVKIARSDGDCPSQFVFMVLDGQGKSECLQEILQSYGLGALLSGSDEVAGEKLTSVELSPGEFHALSKHLPVH